MVITYKLNTNIENKILIKFSYEVYTKSNFRIHIKK
jgi:hypothetical protein